MLGACLPQKLPEICLSFKLQIIIDAHYKYSGSEKEPDNGAISYCRHRHL